MCFVFHWYLLKYKEIWKCLDGTDTHTTTWIVNNDCWCWDGGHVSPWHCRRITWHHVTCQDRCRHPPATLNSCWLTAPSWPAWEKKTLHLDQSIFPMPHVRLRVTSFSYPNIYSYCMYFTGFIYFRDGTKIIFRFVNSEYLWRLIVRIFSLQLISS